MDAHDQCPVCENEVKRDLIVFRNHTRGHLLEAIRQSHPEWAAREDASARSEAFLNAQLVF